MRRRWCLAAAWLGLSVAADRAVAAEFAFWHALSGRHLAAMETLCAGFNAEQETDHVSCLPQGNYDDLRRKVVAAYRAGTQPALAMMPDAATAEMMLSGAIVPVTDLPDGAGPALDGADYIPAVAAPYRASNGRLVSFPFNVSTVLLMADGRKMDRAGVSAPPESWEGLLAATDALRRGGEPCPLVLQTDHAWRLLQQTSAAEGVPIATGDDGAAGLDVRYLFDTGPHRDLMDALARATREGRVVGHLATQAGRATQAFATGECAMSLESSASYALIRAAGVVDLRVGLLPVKTGVARRATAIGGASLWAMKGFDPATARGVGAFLRYLLRIENQVAFTRATGYLPLTVGAGRAFLDGTEAADPARAVVAVALRSLSFPGVTGLRLGASAQVFKAWGDEVSTAFAGLRPMDEALVRSRRRADALAARFARTYPGAAFP